MIARDIVKLFNKEDNINNSTIKYLDNVIIKNKNIVAQSSLTDKLERIKNTKNAFDIGLNIDKIKDKKIAIFDDIFTTTEVGKGKNHPDIFIRAMEKMHTSSENTWMFEDASYSLETAKKIGIKTVGIYDQSSANCQEQLKKVSDIYINNWSESSMLLNTIMNYK